MKNSPPLRYEIYEIVSHIYRSEEHSGGLPGARERWEGRLANQCV